ncbi:MAG: HypC/HybG/HupF family hydrogenase formation chaperone [Pseudomonadota bacterium]
MCLAIPVRIDSIASDERAVASVGGVLREIDITLVDNLQVGDYVILHVGYALSKLNESEALETLRLMEEAGALEETEL